MPTTLKVKNETAAELQIQTSTGPVKIAAGAQADLTENQLTSKGFADALAAGSVSFANVAKPTNEEIALARKALLPLVAATQSRAGTLKGRFDQSQKELLRLRESFNKLWKVAEAQFTQAQTSTAGWKALKNAVKNLLIDTVVEPPDVAAKKKAVADLEEDIEDLKKEDLAVSGRTREQWLADRLAKEQALKEAHAELDKVSSQKADPLIAQVASIDGAVTAIGALTKDNAIGKELPEFGK
jgi:hypothetical protein